MTTRKTLATAAALALAAAGAGTADAAPRARAPRPVCNLVQDAPNDVLTTSKSLDIRSADISATPGSVKAWIRLEDALAPGSDPTTPTGGFFQFQFTYNGTGQVLTAHVTPAGQVYGPDGKGIGEFNADKNYLWIKVKPSDLAGAPVFKAGALLTNFVVRTDVGNPTVPVGSTFQFAGDTATGNTPYKIGYPSCIGW